MKENVYGPLLQDAMIAAGGEGVTASELVDAVGCSRQRVYMWLRDNANTMRAVDKAAHGGTRYAWVDGARQPRGVAVRAGLGGEGLEVGTKLEVSRLRWVGGRMEITMVGPDGIELTSEL